jgi:2',3'-cyclic-nucleotide 2'-phosphodiesterase/3'-nucleotidase
MHAIRNRGKHMEKRIRIYFTSDIHGYFYPTNYANQERKAMGLFQCAKEFEKDGNALVIDGGDILQGSAFSYYCQKELKSSRPIAKIMNLCGYDYITLGNHDFNYGRHYLEEYINQLDAACVCQNVRDRNGNCRYPYAIKTMDNGIRIGIVGIVTDYVNIWEKQENIEHLSITDPFEEAGKALEELKDKVDITICIYHGGFERNLETKELLSETSENIAYRICQELDFDLLLTGHQHMSIKGQSIHGTYVVQPKENGQEYHLIEITFKEEEVNIVSTIKKAKESDDFLMDAISEIEVNVQSWLDDKVGELEMPLLPKQKLKMAQEGNEIANLINQIQLYYSKAQISAASLANDVKGFEKTVTRRDIIATYPYSNTLVVCEITGKALRAAIERSAEYFKADEQGNIGISNQFLEPKVEHYNYDYYAGVEYKIEPRKKAGERVISLKHQNRDITNEDVFTICLNHYRASGAGGYPMYPKCKRVKEINIEMVELILDYFEMHKRETIKIPNSKPICI